MVIQTNESNANMITIKRRIDHNNLTNYHNAMARRYKPKTWSIL